MNKPRRPFAPAAESAPETGRGKPAITSPCTPKVLERDDHHATLAFEDLAPEVLAEPAYLICFRAVILGFFDIAGVEGELEWDVDPARRRAVARVRW